MRTEEVENSIKELTEITDLVKEEIKNNNENTTAILDITDLKSLDTVLNYISEKEKENKFLRDENNIYKNETVSKSVIRDKIKDIKLSSGSDGKDMVENLIREVLIQVLEDLLEGE